MIAEHQPTIFPKDKLVTGMSSIEDGHMRFGLPGGESDEAVLRNREEFLRKLGISISDAAYVFVTFDRDSYTLFRSVSRSEAGAGMTTPNSTEPADGLATKAKNLALFLPLADCNGLILYDTDHHAQMVVHMGRHCTIEDGAKKAVAFMQKEYGSDPKSLLAWLSPAVGKDSYAMEAYPSDPSHFNFALDPRWQDFSEIKGDKVYIDLTGYNRNGLLEAGLKAENIEVCEIDTAKDDRYPSHSTGKPGRYAIAATLR